MAGGRKAKKKLKAKASAQQSASTPPAAPQPKLPPTLTMTTSPSDARTAGESATTVPMVPAKAKAPPNGKQRRDGPRVPLDVLVQVRTDSIEQFKAEHAVNLSMGGMFLRTAELRTVGSEVYFQFTLKDGGPLIEGLGRVVHRTGPSAGSVGGIGIEFLSVLEPSRSIIRRLVEERIARTDAPAA